MSASSADCAITFTLRAAARLARTGEAMSTTGLRSVRGTGFTGRAGKLAGCCGALTFAVAGIRKARPGARAEGPLSRRLARPGDPRGLERALPRAARWPVRRAAVLRLVRLLHEPHPLHQGDRPPHVLRP